jgi:hypothetical protein
LALALLWKRQRYLRFLSKTQTKCKKTSKTGFKGFIENWQSDLIAAISVSLVPLPLALGIAYASNMHKWLILFLQLKLLTSKSPQMSTRDPVIKEVGAKNGMSYIAEDEDENFIDYF